jgi:hypothetical protein
VDNGIVQSDDVHNLGDFLKLAHLCKAGSKFRFAQCSDKCIAAIKHSLARLPLFKDEKTEHPFVKNVISIVRRRLEGVDRSDELGIRHQNGLKAISELQKHFIFCPTDKTSQTIAIVCKNHYYREVIKRLDGPGFAVAYESDLISAKQCLALSNSVEGRDGQAATTNVPYFYIVPKFHKKEEAYRPICGSKSGGNYSTKSAKMLANLLLGVQDSFFVMAMERQREDGVHRVMLVPNIKDVLALVRDWQSLIDNFRGLAQSEQHQKMSLCKTDFSDMYSNLSVEKVRSNCKTAIKMAFHYEKHKRSCPQDLPIVMGIVIFQGKRKGTTWLQRGQEGFSKGFTEEQLCVLLDKVIDNAYVQNGTYIRKQTTGISMGNPASPTAANLTLLITEWDHMEQLLCSEKADKVTTMKGFAGAMRYVDDCCLMSPWLELVPTPEQYGLQYSQKESEAESVVFVGFHISLFNGRFQISMAEKQSAFDMVLIRYPHVESTVDESCYVGCVIGCLSRAREFALDDESFLFNAETLFIILIKRGFIELFFKKAIHRHVFGNVYASRSVKEKKVLETKLLTAFTDTWSRFQGTVQSAKPFNYLFQNNSDLCYVSVALAVFGRMRDLLPRDTITFNETCLGGIGRMVKGLLNHPASLDVLGPRLRVFTIYKVDQGDPEEALSSMPFAEITNLHLLSVFITKNDFSCHSCGFRKSYADKVAMNRILISLPESKNKKLVTLDIAARLENMDCGKDIQCPMCTSSHMTETKSVLEVPPPIILVHAFRSNVTRDTKRTFVLQLEPSVLIKNLSYRLEVVLFHVGLLQNSGHWNVAIRMNEDNWVKIDPGFSGKVGSVESVSWDKVGNSSEAVYAYYVVEDYTAYRKCFRPFSSLNVAEQPSDDIQLSLPISGIVASSSDLINLQEQTGRSTGIDMVTEPFGGNAGNRRSTTLPSGRDSRKASAIESSISEDDDASIALVQFAHSTFNALVGTQRLLGSSPISSSFCCVRSTKIWK